MTKCILVHGKIHHKHYLHSSRLCDSNKVKTLPICIMGYLVEGLWLQILLEVIWATKKIFVFALSLWCCKPVQSMAHHFVAFMHLVRFNILMSVTLKMTVFLNLQPCGLVQLYRYARLHGLTFQGYYFYGTPLQTSDKTPWMQ
jgi:hypothetical protein